MLLVFLSILYECLDGAVVSPIDRLAKQAEIYTSFMNQVQEEPKVEKEQEKSSEKNRRVRIRDNYLFSVEKR